MFHLITGGSGSGKSAFAEDLVTAFHGVSDRPLYYVATMMPFEQEMGVKIRRHRQMREGKGFKTIECYRNLQEGISILPEGRPDVLLECMSNLVSNEWFYKVLTLGQQEASREDVVSEMIEKIWSDVKWLMGESEHLVVVTNEVCSEGEENTVDMECYKEILAGVNRKMAMTADKVTEVVYGIPVSLK